MKIQDLTVEHIWRVAVDYGDGVKTDVAIEIETATTDIDLIYSRIGQSALGDGIDQIIVYRDDKEYRRYILKRPKPPSTKSALLQSVTLRFEYDGKVYEGTAYEVSE